MYDCKEIVTIFLPLPRVEHAILKIIRNPLLYYMNNKKHL